MSGLDYVPLHGFNDHTSYYHPNPAKIVGIGLLLVSAAGWAVSQVSDFFHSDKGSLSQVGRFFQSDKNSLPAFPSEQTERHRLLKSSQADHERYRLFKSSQQADHGPSLKSSQQADHGTDHEPRDPFEPSEGMEEVMIRPAPVSYVTALRNKFQQEPSCLFAYGSLGQSLLAKISTGPTVRPIEGWVYGASYNKKAGPYTSMSSFLATPTGFAGDVVKGWLFFAPSQSSFAQQLAMADELYGYDPSSPNQASVRRGVVRVVRKDGTSEQAAWYFIQVGKTSSPECPMCGQEFSTAAEVTRHLRMHTGQKPYGCRQCNRSFSRSDSLHVHMRVHTGEKPYQCPTCLRNFSQAGPLKSHLRIHSGERPYICAVCNKSFAAAGTLYDHMRTHTGIKPYQCVNCKRNFTSSSALKYHVTTFVCNKTNPIARMCTICNKSYMKEAALQRHLRAHATASSYSRTHSSNIPYKCPHCALTFTSKDELTSHLRTHNNGKKPHSCTECNRSFARLGNLKVHKRVHTGEQPYGCAECGLNFTFSNALKAHIRSHQDEKPYTCTKCNTSFRQAFELQRHMRTHGEKSYPCTRCGRNFPCRSALQFHIRVEKPHICSECNKSFTQAVQLQHHMRSHSGERPYQCAHCGKNFTVPSGLQLHMRTHPTRCSLTDRYRSVSPASHAKPPHQLQWQQSERQLSLSSAT
eukprot:gb/GEZN01002870.1/.p1 GENE.gb/GEZN01002870.1/~~gb/GEZN01002870.1/.p1  ORF type:complete len:692 (+),score=31.98 gb/GEZN01002870.1/:101-2176(+)